MKSIRLGILSLDMVGFSASAACAIHCAAMPFLVTSLPMLGLGFLASPLVEQLCIVFGLVVGVLALRHGFRHHHNATAILILTIGFAAIFVAHSGWVSEELEEVVTPVGASVVALAHLVNWRLSRNACQSENCGHTA
ncbi:MAG: MerC domain-containing protein [Chloroherpetonaceae bacterium]|nr:MerC domain-containing protein [Chloroherpetonaceae bacterium]MDW8020637.1 MerC domain-containing protein [Chloroherpetonaceae bacterium]